MGTEQTHRHTPDPTDAGNDVASATDASVPAAPLSANDGVQPLPKLWSPTFIVLIGVTLFAFLASQGLNAGTPAYISITGGTAAYAGFLTAVFSLASIAARLFSGPLVDRTRRLYVMVAGFACLVIGCGLLIMPPSNTMLVIARILQGAGFSLAAVSAATAAADVLPAERLGEGIGYHGLGQALAMAVGPAAALAIVGTDPATNLFLYCTVIACAGLALSLSCRYERHPESLPATSAFRRRAEQRKRAVETLAAPTSKDAANTQAARSASEGTAILREGEKPAACAPAKRFSVKRLLLIIFEPKALHGALPIFFITPAFGFVITFMSLYGLSIGVQNAGIYFTLTAASMIIVRLFSRFYMDRISAFAIFSSACVCGLVAFSLLIVAPYCTPLYYAAGLVYGIFLGVTMPAAQSVVVRCSPPDRWGAANSLNMLMLDLGFGLGAIVWGAVIDAAGYQVAMGCIMVLIVAAIIMAKLSFPKDA